MPLVDVAVLAALGEELQTFRQVLRAEAKTVGTSQRGDVVADLFVLKTPAGDRTICVASDFAMGWREHGEFRNVRVLRMETPGGGAYGYRWTG